ncbi:MAG: hypothetical protein WD426_00605 [Anditalea sp.]
MNISTVCGLSYEKDMLMMETYNNPKPEKNKYPKTKDNKFQVIKSQTYYKRTQSFEMRSEEVFYFEFKIDFYLLFEILPEKARKLLIRA